MKMTWSGVEGVGGVGVQVKKEWKREGKGEGKGGGHKEKSKTNVQGIE